MSLQRKPRENGSKFGNVATMIGDKRFASKAEAKRYSDLFYLERAGEISDLKLQPRYPLEVNGQKVCTYVADFSYLDKTGLPVTEDVKGVETDVFKIKARLFRAVLRREIKIVRAS